jgi:hypothetical protein
MVVAAVRGAKAAVVTAEAAAKARAATVSELRIVRFRPEHLKWLTLQSAQQADLAWIERPEYGAALSLAGESYTVLAGGHPVACIGVQEHHPQRAEAWALLGDDCGPHMRAITRAVLGWLQTTRYLRVEANVATEFTAAQRWATMLGFHAEGVRRAYLPSGEDATSYARISDGTGSSDLPGGRLGPPSPRLYPRCERGEEDERVQRAQP